MKRDDIVGRFGLTSRFAPRQFDYRYVDGLGK